MKGGGFYKGTSTEQTPFFGDKEKKLMEKLVWPEIYNYKIDVTKINFNVVEKWINKKLIEILGFEDDILYEYCISQLKYAKEKKDDEEQNYLNAKKLKINLTGFIGNKKSEIFVRELLELLISNERNEEKLLSSLMENRKNEMEQAKNQNELINENIKNIKSIYAENKQGERNDQGGDDNPISVRNKQQEKKEEQQEQETGKYSSEQSDSNSYNKKRKEGGKNKIKTNEHSNSSDQSVLQDEHSENDKNYYMKKIRNNTNKDRNKKGTSKHSYGRKYEMGRERDGGKYRHRSRSRERKKHRSRDRDRDRERDRERDRHNRDRERETHRDKERDRHRHMDRERHRDRHRSRNGDWKRERRRESKEMHADEMKSRSASFNNERNYKVKQKNKYEKRRDRKENSLTNSIERSSNPLSNSSTSSIIVKRKRRKERVITNSRSNRHCRREIEKEDGSLKLHKENKIKEIDSIMQKKSYKHFKKKLRAWSSSESEKGEED
ncbi:pre-mRNA splicing factor, putative [Plasmodium malariae]|uniref:Pre-mRNA splicing factor, putative n=1 Tax=Plasmodium malariae TaxID=5858 RepID=A0A1A8WUX7_PLAMA|nr:pre-mRNA splicing factor, putative [Plasmodium malariae]